MTRQTTGREAKKEVLAGIKEGMAIRAQFPYTNGGSPFSRDFALNGMIVTVTGYATTEPETLEEAVSAMPDNVTATISTN